MERVQEYIDNISKQEKKIGKADIEIAREPHDIICEECGYVYGLHRVVGFNCPEYNVNGKFVDWAKSTFKSMPLIETERLEKDKARLLKACQMAHRKHTFNDDGVGWEELSDELSVVLQDIMGDDAYCKWMDKNE